MNEARLSCVLRALPGFAEVALDGAGIGLMGLGGHLGCASTDGEGKIFRKRMIIFALAVECADVPIEKLSLRKINR
jgi:hypothetical protein